MLNKNVKWYLFPLLLAIAALCFLIWFFRLHYLYQATDYQQPTSQTGEWDLTDFNFDAGFVRISGGTSHVPGALLTSEEFDHAPEDALRYGYPEEYPVNTARIRARLPDDGIYMLVLNSIDFSERIYINGEMRQEAGRVGLTAESSTPGFAAMYFEVRPVDGWVEIVRQGANFVHRAGSGYTGVKIGRPEMMKRLIALESDLTALTMGLFLTLFLAHCLLFGILRSYRANLYFALLCLVWCLRTGVTDNKIISSWFPTLPWEAMFRVEYLALPMAGLLILLTVRELFPCVLPRWFTCGMVGIFAISGLLCFLLPTIPLSYCAYIFEGSLIACGLFLSVFLTARLPRLRRSGQMELEQSLMLAGVWLLALSAAHDALYYNNIYLNLFGIGGVWNELVVMILAFLFMGAIFHATLRQVAAAREAQRRADAEKALVEELSRRRSAFYTDISHEMKTPLTVIATNAQFAARNIRKGIIDEETSIDLDAISIEAKRLAQMVTGLVNLGRLQDGDTSRALLSLDEVVGDTAGMYKSLSRKHGNTLTVTIAPDLPMTRGSANQITQVMINLLSNANRHTRNGHITVDARRDGDVARVTVTDTGDGITPDLLSKVFERFSRGHEDGAGLGLPICKAIVEAHGGEIGIESEVDKGTAVWFTLPLEGDVSHE